VTRDEKTRSYRNSICKVGHSRRTSQFQVDFLRLELGNSSSLKSGKVMFLMHMNSASLSSLQKCHIV